MSLHTFYNGYDCVHQSTKAHTPETFIFICNLNGVPKKVKQEEKGEFDFSFGGADSIADS